MNNFEGYKWTNNQQESLDSLREFKTMARSIEKAATELTSFANLQIRGESGRNEIYNCLVHTFEISLSTSRDRFLDQLKREGHNFQNIEEFLDEGGDLNQRSIRENHLIFLAWQSVKGKFLEALCLLSTLLDMDMIDNSEPIKLFGKNGPLRVSNQGGKFYLWTQPLIPSEHSGFQTHPDIVLASTQALPSHANVISITECK